MSKRWIAVLAMLCVVAVGITGGVVSAFDPGRDGDSTGNSFAARVATILGQELTEEQVQDAFQLARKQKQDERYRERLHRQVELGRLTEAEAEANYVWYESRPDTITRGFSRLGHSRFGGRRSRFGFKHGMGWHQQKPDGATSDSTEPTP